MVLGVEEGSTETGVGPGVGATAWMRATWAGWLMRWCCPPADTRCTTFPGLREKRERKRERKKERSSYQPEGRGKSKRENRQEVTALELSFPIFSKDPFQPFPLALPTKLRDIKADIQRVTQTKKTE